MTATPTVPASRLGYSLFDADNHYYEPDDCFTRHIEAKFRDRAIHVVRGDDGLGRLYVGDRRTTFMRVIQSDYTGAPGSQRELWEHKAEGGFMQYEVINAHDYPPMMDKKARLALMDEQGIEWTFMFPSLAVSVEHEIHKDVDASYANLRAFNRWIEEDWGFDDGRILGVPLMSLIDVDQAVAELDRVLALGARLVHVKPGPAYGRGPGAAELDPFWARVDEAGVPVAFHSSDSGYNELWAVHWGEAAWPSIQQMSPFQWYLGYSGRPIADSLASLVLNNLFARFPNLRILSIENGFPWLAGLLRDIDHAAILGRRHDLARGKLAEEPSAILRRHLWVAPFPEEDPNQCIELLGLDHTLFGSDYPHSEGLADPVEFADKLSNRPAHEVEQVMRSNATALMGIPASRGA